MLLQWPLDSVWLGLDSKSNSKPYSKERKEFFGALFFGTQLSEYIKCWSFEKCFAMLVCGPLCPKGCWIMLSCRNNLYFSSRHFHINQINLTPPSVCISVRFKYFQWELDDSRIQLYTSKLEQKGVFLLFEAWGGIVVPLFRTKKMGQDTL